MSSLDKIRMLAAFYFNVGPVKASVSLSVLIIERNHTSISLLFTVVSGHSHLYCQYEKQSGRAWKITSCDTAA